MKRKKVREGNEKRHAMMMKEKGKKMKCWEGKEKTKGGCRMKRKKEKEKNGGKKKGKERKVVKEKINERKAVKEKRKSKDE